MKAVVTIQMDNQSNLTPAWSWKGFYTKSQTLWLVKLLTVWGIVRRSRRQRQLIAKLKIVED